MKFDPSEALRGVQEMWNGFLEAIKNKFLASGIDLPFPTQHVLFHNQTEETDGDCARQREGWPAGKGDAPESRSIASAIGRRTTGQKPEVETSRAGDGNER